MVERIEKVGGHEYWQVAATKETKEEKKRQEKDAQEQKDSFEETSDFTQLFAKDPRKFSRETLAASQIKGFTYRGVSTNRDKSVLEVDISLTNGQLVKGAQIALSRQEGMRYISRRPGEEIVVDQIVQGTMLTVAVPQKGAKAQPTPPMATGPAAASGGKARMGWVYYLGLSALLFAVILLIYLLI